MTEMVALIPKLKESGATLFCWSSGGAAYAQRSGIQRKADGSDKHDSGKQQGVEVSQPGDAAEKEADAVADDAAGALRGDGEEHGGMRRISYGGGASSSANSAGNILGSADHLANVRTSTM